MNDELTVGELIEMLQEFDDEAVVRYASQPSWPFEYELDRGSGPAILVDLNQIDEDEYETTVENMDDPNDLEEAKMVREMMEQEVDAAIASTGGVGKVVYLVEGTQIGYLPDRAAKELDWR